MLKIVAVVFSVGRAVRTSCTRPAPAAQRRAAALRILPRLRSGPHVRVRSFEQVALTQSASRILAPSGSNPLRPPCRRPQLDSPAAPATSN